MTLNCIDDQLVENLEISRGISTEASILSSHLENVFQHFYFNSVYNQKKYLDSIFRTFNAYKEKWINETKYISNYSLIVNNKSYNKIIELGEQVLPLIQKDLIENNHLWFYALEKITGYNPINPENQGDFESMKKDWITWLDKNLN